MESFPRTASRVPKWGLGVDLRNDNTLFCRRCNCQRPTLGGKKIKGTSLQLCVTHRPPTGWPAR